MTAPGFLDTNILVYAFADTEDERHNRARSLVEDLLDRHDATVSVQVLREFHSVVTRKLSKPLSYRAAAEIIGDLCLACRVVDDTLPQLDRALELVGTHHLSIWDASIVAAAEASGCTELHTEDLASGSVVGRVRITNPFAIV
ncbi:MAG: PIN domain-containing protein [Acidobacteria bacterium]|nr:PIN domain-containing protein [Acidobacteriota bacterium]